MSDANFDSSFTSVGSIPTASVSGGPSGTPPALAVVFALSDGNRSGDQPDASWAGVAGGTIAYSKVLTAPGAIAVNQNMAVTNLWAQVLAFFGSNGNLPVFTQLASGSDHNPGAGKTVPNPATGQPGVPVTPSAAGLDLFLFMNVHAFNGTFLNAETWDISDSAGNTYSLLASVANINTSAGSPQFGWGVQVLLFHCPNANAIPSGGLLFMKQTGGDATNSEGLDYYFYEATNIVPARIASLRLLLSLGVGI